jgi:oxygen-dependent protoporphyrinogen oxidase
VKRVLIIGGGIAGLSCAYELRKGGLPVTLLEKERLGGVVRTERHGGLLVEGGPDSFITMKPWAKELCEELGLGDRLIPSRSRKVHLWTGGRLREMPEGLYLTVPTRWWPFLTTDILSLGGKLRMLMDLFIPRGPDVEDESIGSFMRRRLGEEALLKLAEPIMAGIHVASADEISLKSTFPRFMELEREHRSLILAFRRLPAPSGNVSPFLSLKGGMIELVERLIERTAGAVLREDVEVRDLERTEEGWTARAGGESFRADEVVLAVPAPEARRLRPSLPEVKVVSTQTVTLCYPGTAPLEGTGFVIPRNENRRILACTWTSNKFEGRAPEGGFLVRTFIQGEAGDPVGVSREELRSMMGLQAEPTFSRVFSWPGRNPVYEVGHERRIREAEAALPPGLHLCGSGFHGPGLPDCIKDGRAVARRILSS